MWDVKSWGRRRNSVLSLLSGEEEEDVGWMKDRIRPVVVGEEAIVEYGEG